MGHFYNPYDKWILVPTILLVLFGALMVYSSTSVITPALAKRNVTEFHYLQKHLFTLLLGFAVMLAAWRLRPGVLKRFSVPLLAVSLVLLLLVFVPGLGVSAGGARRWLRLWPSTFQPSELVKLAMVVFLARYMSIRDYDPGRFSYFLAPAAVMCVFQAIFLMQPDFGAAISLGVLALGMLYLSGTRMKYLLCLSALAVPVVIKLLMEPYRLKRVLIFLDPWKEARGRGFQLVQSLIAFGSGGLTGVGLGKSRQKLDFLPEVHTDFIFSIVGEELGFFAALSVVAAFALIFWRGIAIAGRAEDGFVRYLCFGLSMMVGLQALVNFSVATGMMPTKGLPLPFISYGGSALLVNMAAVGMLLGVSRPHRESGGDRLSEALKKKKARRARYGVAG